MSKRSLIAKLAYAIGADKLCKLLNINKRHFVVLAYHRILPKQKWDTAGDYELISATPEQFDAQIRYLKRHCSIIGINDLIEHFLNSSPLPHNAVLITFDDGFEDNYLYAAPILEKYHAPAVIFCATDYLNTEKCIWFEAVSLIVRRRMSQLSRKGLRVSAGRTIERVLASLKSVDDKKRNDLVKRMITKYGLSKPFARMLTHKQVQELASMNIVCASHTASHPILTRLPTESIDNEIQKPKGVLEEITHTPCQSFSYPNGGKGDYDERIVKALKKSGYKVAFNYQTGKNAIGSKDPYDLNRVHVERYTSAAEFALALYFPRVFSYE